VPSWIAPDGTVHDLNPPGSNMFTLDAVSGLGIAPVDIVTDPDPKGGTQVRYVQPRSRNITWPIRLRGATHMEFLILWRIYAYAFAQTRRLGAGILRLTRPDGSAREIECLYAAGFDLEPGQGWLEDTAVLSLFCPDPFWRDVVPITITREDEGTALEDFLDPYPSLSTGSALEAPTVFNPGNVEAWPVWTLTGPLDEFVATNLTTGKTFSLVYTLLADETITIVTRPDVITGPGDINLINALDWPDSDLWRFEPGTNEVEFQVFGSAAGTRIDIEFYPRYETA
jgi:hypothetical protein